MQANEQPSQESSMMNADMIARIERLSRQTSLAALETVLDIGVESSVGASCSKAGLMAKAVATHIIRASIEMQQTIHQTMH